MEYDDQSTRHDRRVVVSRLGGLTAVAVLGARFFSPTARAQADPAATPDPTWTPPPIPQPLPTPGGTPVTPVGAAPATESPAPANVDNPAAGGTPAAEASPIAPPAENPVAGPGEPAQPATESDAATPVAAPPATTVTLTPDFRFDPPEVRIRRGEAVRWVNAGRSPQTVTADPSRVADPSLVALPDGAEPWDSGVLNAGDDFERSFDTPGEYIYVSIPQAGNGMSGRVIVEG